MAAAVGMASLSSASFAGDTLRIVSWGGAYQKGQSVGIFSLQQKPWALL